MPRPTDTYFGSDLHDPRIVGKNRNKSVALSDTLGLLDDRVLLTVGVRRAVDQRRQLGDCHRCAQHALR